MYRLILLATLVAVGSCHWADYDWPDDHEGPDDDHNDWPDPDGPDHDHDGPDHDHNDWPDPDGPDHDHSDWPDHDHKDWPDADEPNHDHDGPAPNDCSHDKCKQTDPDDWHSSHDRRFQKMSSYITKADKYAQKFCNTYTNVGIQEVFEASRYQVTYSLPACDAGNINVKIGHRVLYMYARKSSADNSEKFFDIRILPAMLKMADAVWQCDGNNLVVAIPHDDAVKSKLEREKTCLDVNENVITVPEAPAFIYYRYGK